MEQTEKKTERIVFFQNNTFLGFIAEAKREEYGQKIARQLALVIECPVGTINKLQEANQNNKEELLKIIQQHLREAIQQN